MSEDYNKKTKDYLDFLQYCKPFFTTSKPKREKLEDTSKKIIEEFSKNFGKNNSHPLLIAILCFLYDENWPCKGLLKFKEENFYNVIMDFMFIYYYFLIKCMIITKKKELNQKLTHLTASPLSPSPLSLLIKATLQSYPSDVFYCPSDVLYYPSDVLYITADKPLNEFIKWFEIEIDNFRFNEDFASFTFSFTDQAKIPEEVLNILKL